MQRMSLLSGVFANRPTPEIVNAIWGGVGYGLIYLSTDTSQIFQWNGAAWVDITVAIIGIRPTVAFKDNTLHVHTGTATEDVVHTIPVAANSMGVGGVVRCTFSLNFGVFSASPVIRIRFGGTLLVTYIVPGTGVIVCSFFLGNRGAANSQIMNAVFDNGGSATNVFTSTSALDTTLGQNITITMQNNAPTDSQNFNQIIAEQL
jgi:hypothetical protein